MKYLQTEANSELTLCALSWMSRTCEDGLDHFFSNPSTEREMQKACNLVNTFELFFPHPVLQFGKKKAFHTNLRRFFLANSMQFLCVLGASFVVAKSGLVLIFTLFECLSYWVAFDTDHYFDAKSFWEESQPPNGIIANSHTLAFGKHQ